MPIDTSPEGAELLHQPVVKPFPEPTPKEPTTPTRQVTATTMMGAPSDPPLLLPFPPSLFFSSLPPPSPADAGRCFFRRGPDTPAAGDAFFSWPPIGRRASPPAPLRAPAGQLL